MSLKLSIYMVILLMISSTFKNFSLVLSSYLYTEVL